MDDRPRAPKPATLTLFAAIVLVVALGVCASVVLRHQTWTPDGYHYAVSALVDTGMSKEEAVSVADRFYAATPLARDPRYASLVRVPHHPDFFWALFAPRVVYPFAASLLYRAHGLRALTDVSAIAYVLAALAIFWFLLDFGRPSVAAFGAIVFAVWPNTIALAEADLTDMTSMLFWIIVLAAACRLIGHGGRIWYLVFALACVLFSFTRPVPYLAFGAGVGVLLKAGVERDRALALRGAYITAVAAACTVALMLVLRAVHAPDAAFYLAYARQHSGLVQSGPFLTWYLSTLLSMIRPIASLAVKTVLPLAAMVGVIVRRQHPCVPLLVGSGAFSMISIIANPILWDVPRTFEFPLAPIVLAGCALLVDALRTRRATGPIRAAA